MGTVKGLIAKQIISCSHCQFFLNRPQGKRQILQIRTPELTTYPLAMLTLETLICLIKKGRVINDPAFFIARDLTAT